MVQVHWGPIYIFWSLFIFYLEYWKTRRLWIRNLNSWSLCSRKHEVRIYTTTWDLWRPLKPLDGLNHKAKSWIQYMCWLLWMPKFMEFWLFSSSAKYKDIWSISFQIKGILLYIEMWHISVITIQWKKWYYIMRPMRKITKRNYYFISIALVMSDRLYRATVHPHFHGYALHPKFSALVGPLNV